MAAAVPEGAAVHVPRALVHFLDEPLFTRLEAERRLGILCRTAGLPLPRMNTYRAGWEVDAARDAQRLVVEVDGRKFHSTCDEVRARPPQGW